jgi:hypothetical protein
MLSWLCYPGSEVNRETSDCQAGHDRVVGINAMSITLGLEGLLQDEVAICVKGDHHILVARLSSDRKVAGVIGEELAQRLCHDGNVVGS